MAKILRTLEHSHFNQMDGGWLLPYVDAAIISQSEPNMVRATRLVIARPEIELIRYYNVLTKPLDGWNSAWFDFVHRYIPAIPNVRFPWFGNPEIWDWPKIGPELQAEIRRWMDGLAFPARRFFLDHHWRRPADWMFDAPVEIDADAWERNITDCFDSLISPIVNGDQTSNSVRYIENAQAIPEPKRTELWRANPLNILSFNVDRCLPETYAEYVAQAGWTAFTCDLAGNDSVPYANRGAQRLKEIPA